MILNPKIQTYENFQNRLAKKNRRIGNLPESMGRNSWSKSYYLILLWNPQCCKVQKIFQLFDFLIELCLIKFCAFDIWILHEHFPLNHFSWHHWFRLWYFWPTCALFSHNVRFFVVPIAFLILFLLFVRVMLNPAKVTNHHFLLLKIWYCRFLVHVYLAIAAHEKLKIIGAQWYKTVNFVPKFKTLKTQILKFYSDFQFKVKVEFLNEIWDLASLCEGH